MPLQTQLFLFATGVKAMPLSGRDMKERNGELAPIQMSGDVYNQLNK